MVDMGYKKVIEIPTPDNVSKQDPKKAAYEQAILAAELGSVPELDLHALYPDEAIRTLDAEISHHAAVGTDVLQIIHGRGEGVLKKAVKEHLSKNPLVAYFRDAEHPGKQGGVTYAVLHDARMKRS